MPKVDSNIKHNVAAKISNVIRKRNSDVKKILDDYSDLESINKEIIKISKFTEKVETK